MNDIVDKIMAEAAEKVRREGYAAGWRDAIAAITKAAGECRPPDMPSFTEAADDRREDGAGTVASTGNLPAVGTIPHYVLAAVKRHPGVSGAEIVGHVRDEGHKFAEPQIRTSLARMSERGLIVNRHKKWFPK
jgi:hypothetical protein